VEIVSQPNTVLGVSFREPLIRNPTSYLPNVIFVKRLSKNQQAKQFIEINMRRRNQYAIRLERINE